MSHHRTTITAAGALLCLALAGSASAAISSLTRYS